jgi:hypothetical protein
MNTLLTALIRYQMALLDAYVAGLDKNGWGEAQMNAAMKSWAEIMLPALQAHCALCDQMLTAHRKFIEQYRSQLQAELRKYEGKYEGTKQ